MDKGQHKRQTIEGARWAVRDQVTNQLINFGVGIALARLLGPEVFGLFAMVMIIIGFLGVFKDLGLPEAIIQDQALDQQKLSAAFWLQVLFSLFLVAFLALMAKPIALFYQKAILQDLTWLIALSFIFEALYASQSALLQKQLNFQKLFYINVVATAVAGGVAVGMALTGYGIWSLVARLLLFSATSLLLFWITSGWWPQLSMGREAIQPLLNFSLPLKASQILNYIVRNIDDLLIGKYLGAAELGAYNRAYTIMLMPLQHLSNVVTKVMFPALSQIQSDKETVRQIFLKMGRVVASITFPAMAILAILSAPFILAILGEEWSATIPVLQILCILGATQSIGTFNGIIFQSQGATKAHFRLHLLTKPFLIGMISLGFLYTRSISGVALFYMIGSLITLIISWRVVSRLVGSNLGELLGNLRFLMIPLVGTVLLAYGLDHYLLLEQGYWLRLILTAMASGLFYLLLFRIFAPLQWGEVWGMIEKMLGRND
ncbi:MAG: lipopolysaccharide biosynthesis protein [Bacteroidota bacterium]